MEIETLSLCHYSWAFTKHANTTIYEHVLQSKDFGE